MNKTITPNTEEASEPDLRDESDERPRAVIGIGASAGGLESLEHLVRNLPADTGMAFVIIQHLSPDYRSMMDELLARHSDMPIRVVTNKTKVLANHIYLLPPRKEMIIEGGRLMLSDKERTHSLTLPIDKFFRSLAKERGPEAVAIILSGTGSDGSRGICDVKHAGGRVVVEDPQSAKFDGMPLSALATDMVDHVAAAADMPRWLLGAAGGDATTREPGAPNGDDVDESPMDTVLRLLRSHSSIDFSFYKTSTVGRRIERRLALTPSSDLAEYAEQLENDPDELNSLYHDLLIGVTRFFRDPECFQTFEKQIVPELLERVPAEQELRVWVAGCATGEEAYSIAMILFEAFTAAGRPLNLKVLATDVHRSSLQTASRGLYGEEQLVHVSAKRRARFFSKRERGYQVSQDLRQLIVFAPHNVTKDAPFTKMHLITCRNLLIYLEPGAQNTVISLFHFGLASNGILFLGSSESPGALANEFTTLDEHCKFFRKRRDVRLLEPRRLSLPGAQVATRILPSQNGPAPDGRVLWLYDRLLDRYMPPGFLVNEDLDLVDSFAGAERWLKVNRRRPSTKLRDLMSPELRTVAEAAIRQALRHDKSVHHAEVSLTDPGGDVARYELCAEPMDDARTASHYVLVTLRPTRAEPPAVAEDSGVEELVMDADSNERLQTLEGELSYARETLQATVEELQTSNEQLQATNEELVASNEELQSTNEELHSVNEELYSVNAEHQRKIVELRELNADMQHLLEGTDIGTLFLDDQLRIRKYTPRIASVFHIQPQDVGRSVSDFSHKLRRDTLIEDIQQTLAHGTTLEDEVRDVDGGIYFLRILPYRPLEPASSGDQGDAHQSPSIGGVVITLTDIAVLDRARARLAQLSAIVESSDHAIVGTSTDGVIESWNRGAVRLYGYSQEEAVGERIELLGAPPAREALKSMVEASVGGRSVEHVEIVCRRRDGQAVEVSVTTSPIVDQEGAIVGASLISRDITPLRQAQRQLQARSDRINLLLDSTAEAIFGLEPDGRCAFSNRSCAKMLGYGSASELIGQDMHQMLRARRSGEPPYAKEHCPICSVLTTGEGAHSDAEIFTRADGSMFQAEHWSHPIRDNGTLVGAVVTFLDITDRKRAEDELRLASERRERFLAMLSHELRNPLSAVLSATRVMQSKKADAKAVGKARGVIQRQAKHMACLLEDLLDVSRITRGGIQLKKSPVDVRVAVQMAVEALSPALKARDIQLRLDLCEQPLVVEGDLARLQQIVANLLSNAARYSPKGTPVTVTAANADMEILIRVEDRGSGISPSTLPHIFDMFYQHGQGLDRAKGGLGIGLTLVRQIAEMHGGRARAHSDGIGHGSQFSVWLPRSVHDTEAPESTPVRKHPPRRVLIVEDQDDAREMLRLVLEARGNRVFEAADGASALESIRKEKPDLALVDIGLPTMSGFDVARAVRADSALDGIRLVALTGYGTHQDVRAAREAGFDNHLTKPADPNSIEHLLADL